MNRNEIWNLATDLQNMLSEIRGVAFLIDEISERTDQATEGALYTLARSLERLENESQETLEKIFQGTVFANKTA